MVVSREPCLTETASLTLRLHETEDVVLTDGALDVTDDATALVVDELNANLGDTTAGAGAAENLGNLSELDGGLGVHCGVLMEMTEKIGIS